MTYPDLVPLAVLEGCRDWVFDVIWLGPSLAGYYPSVFNIALVF